MQMIDRIRQWARGLKREGVALWFALRHPATPWLPKVLCGIVVAYALSPIDLIPDFIPVLGFVDDALLLPGLIWLVIRLMPADLMADCRRRADDWLQSGGKRPRSMAGAAAIVVLWVASATLAGGWWLNR